MAPRIHVFDFLKEPPKLTPVCVLFGGESFLQRLALQQIRRKLHSGQEGDDSESFYSEFDGALAEWRDVDDELSTVSLFGGQQQRLAVVADADPFIKAYRPQLEAYVQKPSRVGVLVLQCNQWVKTTLLAKAVEKQGLAVHCGPPEIARGKSKSVDLRRIQSWLIDRGKQPHKIKLDRQAAELLIDLRGLHFGLLDQELAKLALYDTEGGKVTAELVQDVVGGWKSKSIWDLIDLAADGDAAEAIRQLDGLLRGGENALGIFGQLAWGIRRFAAAAHYYEHAEKSGKRIRVRDALLQAGFRQWPQGALERAERQLKRITRRRAVQLYQWLMDLDRALKGSHSTPERARDALEHFFFRLTL